MSQIGNTEAMAECTTPVLSQSQQHSVSQAACQICNILLLHVSSFI